MTLRKLKSNEKNAQTAVLLQAVALTKRYVRRGETFDAVSDVSLTVNGGEFICITGKSGSGKSTLLNLLTGLMRPDEGKMCFEGDDLARLDDRALSRVRGRRIGYIPQGRGILYDLSVLDNVRLPCYLAGGDTREGTQQAKLLLERVGILHLAHELPQNLSGGEQRRVAIARSLILSPALLIADEPTGDLDAETTDKMLNIFTDVRNRGTAVIMVTHETALAKYADRCCSMEAGRLL